MPVEFGEFAGTKRLGKCRESLEEIAQLPVHFEPIRDLFRGRKVVLGFCVLSFACVSVIDRFDPQNPKSAKLKTQTERSAPAL